MRCLHRKAIVAAALLGIALFGAVTWLVYLVIAWSGCHGGGVFVMFNAKRGGAASGNGLLVAALLGLVIWGAVGVVGFRFRPRLPYLYLSFMVLYAVALVVLWYLSPVFWGARHCTY